MFRLFTKCLIFFVVTSNIGYSQKQAIATEEHINCCEYWYTRVIGYYTTEAEPINDLSELEFIPKAKKLNDQDFSIAVKCLLKLEGNQKSAAFDGPTSIMETGVSGQATVEVAALFYISFLYYEKWDHAKDVALIDEASRANRPKAVKKAFASYRKWFKKVAKIGLDEARKQKIDPLKGSGVRWY